MQRAFLSLTVALFFLLAPMTRSFAGMTVHYFDTHAGANTQRFLIEHAFPKVKSELGIEVAPTFSTFDSLSRLVREKGPNLDIDVMVIHPSNVAKMLRSPDHKYVDMRDHLDRVPHLKNVIPLFFDTILGAHNEGRAVPQWINFYGFLYDTNRISSPPTSFRKLIEQVNNGEFADQGKGRFGLISPGAKSAGGRKLIWSLLHALGCSFKFLEKPDPDEPVTWIEDDTWEPGWEVLRTMVRHKAIALPLVSSGSHLFNQFHTGKISASIYSADYFLWSMREGRIPDHFAVGNLSEGLPFSSSYWLIPADAPHLKAALALCDHMLSPDFQVAQFEHLFLLPSVRGNNVHQRLSADVYGKLTPTWEQLQETGVILGPPDAVRYIQAVALKKMGL